MGKREKERKRERLDRVFTKDFRRALCLDFSNLKARLNFHRLILKFSSNCSS